MKKKVMWIWMTAGLLLLISCGKDRGAGPIQITNGDNTPTPIIVPTCTPTASPTPDPARIPSVTPSVEAQPTATATPEPTVTPTPEATAILEATATPTATTTPEPTATPEPAKKPTEAPEPTEVPEATATPTPSPTPTINPEPLVNYGWQKTVSIDEKYSIIFPEVFRESVLEKTDRELVVTYSSEENSGITFCISYIMNKTLEDAVSDVLAAEGSVLEGAVANQRIVCRWQEDNTVCRGILLEAQYPQSLLGNAFGEQEWITGVMQVVFSYPADRYAEYETTEYNFYVIENREE